MSHDAPLATGSRSIAGREVGALAFGCWRLTDGDAGRCADLVEAAVELGLNLVDNADVYGLDWGGRGFGTCEEGIVPGTPYDSGASYLVAACEASLRRLGVDAVDLYQIHRPDHFAHPAEVAAALASLRDRGLIGGVGVSNHTVAQTRALQAHLPFPIVSTQPEFSALALDPLRDGVLDMCMEVGLLPLAWSPIAGGRLATGDGVRPELITVLDAIAADHGVSRTVVAVAFVLGHPSSPVAILGTQNIARIVELSAATSLVLTRAESYRIIEASDGRPLP